MCKTTKVNDVFMTPDIKCHTDCACLEVTSSNVSSFSELDECLYTASQGEIILETWTIAVIAIASSGTFISLTFTFYILYKIHTRALGKRYIGLGLALLLSLKVLFISVVPFVFTPCEAVCGLRFFLSGIAFSLCFGVILVKLMTLENYKLIGLGGEVSGVNQCVSVFFIWCVQISIGVQWWLYNTPATHLKIDRFGVEKHACNFDRRDFVIYHVYNMFLIVVCALYAIRVRNEKKNMGESKLLLACCWACLLVWIAWPLCLFYVDRKWSEIIVCSAILASATMILLIVFIPKMRMVSRLKYELAQKVNVRNGCSVDTDFLYERPHSLPGTLSSTFSSGKMNYPKTLTNFESDANY